jgi:hypothetical protein
MSYSQETNLKTISIFKKEPFKYRIVLSSVTRHQFTKVMLVSKAVLYIWNVLKLDYNQSDFKVISVTKEAPFILLRVQ